MALSRKDSWHLGDVDLSKLEGESPQRAARVRAYLEGGEERYQEERNSQHRADILKELEQKLADDKIRRLLTLPPNEVQEEIASEELDELHQDNNDLATVIEGMGRKMSRALATAIQAIHDIEGDDSFETDDLQMAIAYLAALQDPQD